ncbi:hypothetical protein HRG_013377 [Hirsutella rhossiliensis]
MKTISFGDEVNDLQPLSPPLPYTSWQIQYCTQSELSTQITIFHSVNSEEAPCLFHDLAANDLATPAEIEDRPIVTSHPRVFDFISVRSFIPTITLAADATALR